MKDRHNVSHRFQNHLKINSSEEPYDLAEIRNDEQNIVDPVPDLSCFPPKTRNSGNKGCFYFGGKTPNLTIAATIFLLLQYTVAFLLSKLCAPVHEVNQFSPFCEPDLIISRRITSKSLEFDRISTVAAKASCVNTFVFSVYSQIHQQNEPLTLLPLTC